MDNFLKKAEVVFEEQDGLIKLLDILVPTRNRPQKLFGLLRILKKAFDDPFVQKLVKVVVVINDTPDKYAFVMNAFQNEGWLLFRVNFDIKETAEESAISASRFSDAEYIWYMGDDDHPIINKLGDLLELLITHKPSYTLLNILLYNNEELVKYYSLEAPIIKYESSFDLYKDLGFISATTTLSAICIRRECINIEEYLTFNRISSIYSHSVYFMYATYNKPCILWDVAGVLKNENSPEDEFNSIQKYLSAKGETFPYSFTIGLLHLLSHLSEKLNTSLDLLLGFNELEFSKSTNQLVRSRTVDFIRTHMQSINQNDIKELNYYRKSEAILKPLAKKFGISSVTVLPNKNICLGKQEECSGWTGDLLSGLKNILRKLF